MKAYELYHPESPGMKVIVVRSWWQRIFYPKDFATLGETIRYNALRKYMWDNGRTFF